MRHLCEWCHSIMGQHPCTLIKIVKTLSVMLVTTALLRNKVLVERVVVCDTGEGVLLTSLKEPCLPLQ